jgi:hypothetical protein
MKTAWLLVLALALPVQAQQTANAALDACIRSEQRSKARTGAVLGFLGGLVGGVSSSRGDGRGGGVGVQVGVGTAGGGAAGLAVAYYTAVDQCLRQHPEWIPASQLVRDGDYADTLARHAYEPAQGPRTQVLAIEGPEVVAAGETLELRSRLLLLTPQGDEARVSLERRLFVQAEGEPTEQALRYLGQAEEQRVLSPGEHLDVARLPIPKGLPAGVVFRYELLLRLDGLAPSARVHRVIVQ